MKRLALLVSIAAVAAGFAIPGAFAAAPLKISADKALLKYNVSKLSAKAGTVTIVMTNPSPLQHNVAIKGKGVNVKGKIVGKGGTSTVTVKLKRGSYRFYCTVPGHEAAGMWGTLTVK